MIKLSDNLAIKTVNLSKYFDTVRAVYDVNLSIPEGEAYGLVGPNGAGKTTLLKLLVGLYSPTGGYASIFNYDIAKEPLSAKKLIGYVPDDPSAYDYLSGWEFLAMTGNLRGLPKEKLAGRLKELAGIFPLEGILEGPMSSYSRGNKQKVAFLGALISKPPVLIIDEPIAGLDPRSVDIFGQTLRSFVQKGGTALLVSHSLSFVDKFVDKLGVMIDGKIVKEAKRSEITSVEKFSGIV